jgi:hypothetical protein
MIIVVINGGSFHLYISRHHFFIRLPILLNDGSLLSQYLHPIVENILRVGVLTISFKLEVGTVRRVITI